MIIDGHAYVHPDPDGFGKRYDARLDVLLQNLEESQVDKAVLLPIAEVEPYLKSTPNSYVAECCAKYPDKLIGFASVHPLKERDAAKRLEEDIRKYDLKGLKIHPRFQGFSADDPRLVPLIEKAAELNIPVAIDCMLWKPTPLHMQHPFNIDVLCKRVPRAKVIVCHAGGWMFMEALAVAVANDNVYLDLSLSLEYFSGTPFEDQFIFALKQVGARRLIYGSDHPQSPLKDSYPRCKVILSKHLFSDEDLDYIFGKTILSLLPPPVAPVFNRCLCAPDTGCKPALHSDGKR